MQDMEEIRKQLIWNRLISAIEEQAQTVIHTAFSQSVRECCDLSAGVFNRRGQMVAQAVTGTPGHVNSMAPCAEHFIDKFPIDTMIQVWMWTFPAIRPARYPSTPRPWAGLSGHPKTSASWKIPWLRPRRIIP